MPYSTQNELPDSVRQNLPEHAREIYKEAFNAAWEQYAREKDRKGDDSREEIAHKVAWVAVKQTYRKSDKGWVKK